MKKAKRAKKAETYFDPRILNPPINPMTLLLVVILNGYLAVTLLKYLSKVGLRYDTGVWFSLSLACLIAIGISIIILIIFTNRIGKLPGYDENNGRGIDLFIKMCENSPVLSQCLFCFSARCFTAKIKLGIIFVSD